jgi:DNA-binding transcriptional MerR regulator
LQQILTLRYLGFPLKQIGELLDRPGFDLVASMHAQRRALRDRIADLQRVDAVLGDLLEARRGSDEWRWDLIVAAVAAARDGLEKEGATMDKVKSYYTPEQLAQFEEIGREVGPVEIKSIEDAWTDLLREVRANHDLDPADPRARALAARWETLHQRTMSHYQAHPDLMQAIRQNYEAGNLEGFGRAPQAADIAFIERAKAARSSAGEE